ncbi:MAG: FmdB family zinc ribbon protein [Actinomycetota bacterium]
MPTYEYKCIECERHFEIEQRISDDTLTAVPGCELHPDGECQVKKVFSAVGIAFKGDGFYRNDARSTSGSSSSSSTSSSSGSSSSDSSSSSSSGSSSSDSSSSSSTSTTTSSSSSSD